MAQLNAKIEQPRPSPPRTPVAGMHPAVGMREIKLQSGCTARDLGGYPTHGGGLTRHGVAYRSSSPATLTQSDQRALRALGLVAHIDLRCDFEVCALGPADFGDVRIRAVRVPLINAADAAEYARQLWQFGGQSADPLRARTRLYEHMLDKAGPALAQAFEVAAIDIPTIHHCSTGRDRTGLLSALLLRVADVPDPLIAWDYACGLALPSDQLAAERSMLADHLAEPGRARWAPPPPADRGAPLLAALAHLDRRWGGAEAYLVTHGVKPGRIDAFREIFVDHP